MTSACAQNTQLLFPRWAVFSLDNIEHWETYIRTAVDDLDVFDITPYVAHMLQIASMRHNGLEIDEYIEINDIHWVYHADITYLTDTILRTIGWTFGMQRQIRIGIIHETTDFIVEYR